MEAAVLKDYGSAPGSVDGRRVYFDSPVAPFGSLGERKSPHRKLVIEASPGRQSA